MSAIIQSAAKNATEVDLNRVVTPMLDMTFQILFFLIMNFQMPTAEGQVPLLFPKAGSDSTITNVIALDAEPEEYRLRVHAQAGKADPGIGSLDWKPKQTPAEVINSVDPKDEKDAKLKKLDPVLYGLVEKLREVQPKKGAPQPTIIIECDATLKYSEVLRVMDVLRLLKFEKISVRAMGKDK